MNKPATPGPVTRHPYLGNVEPIELSPEDRAKRAEWAAEMDRHGRSGRATTPPPVQVIHLRGWRPQEGTQLAYAADAQQAGGHAVAVATSYTTGARIPLGPIPDHILDRVADSARTAAHLANLALGET